MEFPGSHVLHSAGGYGDPDSQFWLAGSHRYPGHRPRLARQSRFIDRLLKDISYVPGTADLHIQQPFNNPHFLVDVNRSKAQDIGLTQRDVAGSLLVADQRQLSDQPHLLARSKKRC